MSGEMVIVSPQASCGLVFGDILSTMLSPTMGMFIRDSFHAGLCRLGDWRHVVTGLAFCLVKCGLDC